MIKKEKYIVLVKNLILKASVGIYPKEKIRKQKVRFNISITANDNIKTKNDISEFVSYEDVIKIVQNVTNKKHRYLAETVAEEIADRCLELKNALSIQVDLRKPDIMEGQINVGVKVLKSKS